MYTKADFQEAIRNSIAAYPTIALRYQAGDPRILQQLDAQATMLAMISAQMEAAQNEAFQKSRDSTILADAAMRGIVRKGKAARARITVKNGNAEPFAIAAGRSLVDSSGMVWRVETAVTIPGKGTMTIEATQKRSVTIRHTVTDSVPFYAIEIPEDESGGYLCEIAVSDAEGAYQYRDAYLNTAVGEKVFHVEADESQRVYVRFGYGSVVGYQPADGKQITLRVFYTNGPVSPAYGSVFAFESMGAPEETNVDMTMDALVQAGSEPVSMTVLRDLAKYPSVYRRDAVFLGEFGFLVRENFPDAQFISVWNETLEEQARGPNVKNINKLFVAIVSADGTEKTVEDSGDTQPLEIKEEELTSTQKSVRTLINAADDSYGVRFFTPVVSKIKIEVHARVATSYVAKDVKAQITETLLNAYGKTAAASRRGQQRPLYRQIYDLLKGSVTALTDGEADLTVSIDKYDDQSVRPELWRFVDESSLTVTVETSNIIQHTWGG